MVLHRLLLVIVKPLKCHAPTARKVLSCKLPLLKYKDMDTCHIFYHQMFNSEDSIILLDILKNKIAKSPYPVENNVSTMYQI